MVLFCSSWRRQSTCLAIFGSCSLPLEIVFIFIFSFKDYSSSRRFGSLSLDASRWASFSMGQCFSADASRKGLKLKLKLKKIWYLPSENRGCVNELINSFICACALACARACACANEFNHLELACALTCELIRELLFLLENCRPPKKERQCPGSNPRP